ncbi:hypothetical protein ABVT39_011287 [Epinephelus coioides]
MAPAPVILELKSELQSIEQLIQDLLQRQSVLVSQLACLEPVDNQRPLAPDPTAVTSDGPGLNSTPWSSCGPGPKALLSHQRHLALGLAILFISPPRRKRPRFSQPQKSVPLGICFSILFSIFTATLFYYCSSPLSHSPASI